jgi:serine/threonine protein kinase
MKIAAGVEIGPYHVVEQVGRGGMATVFKAYQPALERYVAIKVLPEFLADEPDFRERFRREAVSIAKLRHPGILSVFDHGEFEGQPYIVTEFVEGGTFQQQLAGKPITVQQTLEVLQPIAAAIDYAHERGVLHRDIKPSNILITKEGAPVLGDFGLARMMTSNERLTRIDSVVGTPEYMAPEQCAGKETGPAADRYSFGVVAYEALTGHVPYQAETPAAVMLAQMQQPLPDPRVINPGINENVERALLRMLSKEPEQRFQSCSAFVRALAATDTPMAGEPRVAAAAAVVAAVAPPTVNTPLPATSVPAPQPPRSTAQGRGVTPFIIGAGVLVLLLALAGVVYAVGLNKGSTHTSTPAASTGVKHGSLINPVDLAHGGWSNNETPSPDPNGSITLANASDGLVLKIQQDDASLSGEFDGPGLKNYVAHVVLRADQGSDMEFDWAVRSRSSSETADVFLNIEVAEESMTLFLSPDGGSNQALTAALPVKGLQAGSTMDLWIVVNGKNIQLYLGSTRVGDVNETSASGATTPNFYMQGKKNATMHLLTVAYYAVS